MKSLRHLTKKAQPSKSVTIRTRWRKPTAHLRTLDGKLSWPESTQSNKLEILGLSLTSMQVKPRCLSEFCFTLEKNTRSVKFTKALRKWTGWNRSGSGGLPLRLRPRPVFGRRVGKPINCAESTL